jgi:hypothetical protein
MFDFTKMVVKINEYEVIIIVRLWNCNDVVL